MFTRDLLPLWPRVRIGVMSDLSDFLSEASPLPMTVRAAVRVRVGRGEWPSPPEMVCLRQDALARPVVSLVLGGSSDTPQTGAQKNSRRVGVASICSASVGVEGTRAVRMITCQKSVHCGQRGGVGKDSQDTGGWVEA